MPQTDVLCSCGTRFTVQDDGNGRPHACPQCGMQNVLPRVRAGAATPIPDVRSVANGARTAVRSTEVLSRSGITMAGALRGLDPGTRFGRYSIVRQIGRGGMGTVYEAHDEAGGKVALKVLSPELAQKEDFVKRFSRESRAMEELDDDRIARIHFSGAADGLPFFAMEFVDGKNLEELLEAEGTFTAARAIELMREAARGLLTASEFGIIHRDVKPTNLIVDREGKLKIVDFGLAKSVDAESRLTVTGAVVGTPYYLSPEQGLGKPVDERADIYSLGATFYHLLCGEPPFDADSPVSIIMCHVNESPEILTDRAEIPEALGRVIMRCIAKDPARRYPGWEELLADLDALEAGEPVSAPSQEASIKTGGPSVVMMDHLEEGSTILRRASRVRRGFAMVLDLTVLGAVAALAREVLSDFNAFLTVGGATFLYLALGEGFGGRAVGKRFFRLRVSRPDGTGPGFFPGVLRAVALLPVALLFTALFVRPNASQLADALSTLGFPGGLSNPMGWFQGLVAYAVFDVLVSFFTRRTGTLHDLVSGTGVFREDRVKRKKKKKRKKRADQGPMLKRPKVFSGYGRPPGPALVGVAAVLVPGIGQLFNGQLPKATIFWAGFIVLALLTDDGVGFVPLWIVSILDAITTAKRRVRAYEERHSSSAN